MSLAKFGPKHPMFGKTGVLSPMFGKKPTVETCQKISETLKGEDVFFQILLVNV